MRAALEARELERRAPAAGGSVLRVTRTHRRPFLRSTVIRTMAARVVATLTVADRRSALADSDATCASGQPFFVAAVSRGQASVASATPSRSESAGAWRRAWPERTQPLAPVPLWSGAQVARMLGTPSPSRSASHTLPAVTVAFALARVAVVGQLSDVLRDGVAVDVGSRRRRRLAVARSCRPGRALRGSQLSYQSATRRRRRTSSGSAQPSGGAGGRRRRRPDRRVDRIEHRRRRRCPSARRRRVARADRDAGVRHARRSRSRRAGVLVDRAEQQRP